MFLFKKERPPAIGARELYPSSGWPYICVKIAVNRDFNVGNVRVKLGIDAETHREISYNEDDSGYYFVLPFPSPPLAPDQNSRRERVFLQDLSRSEQWMPQNVYFTYVRPGVGDAIRTPADSPRPSTRAKVVMTSSEVFLVCLATLLPLCVGIWQAFM